MTKAQSSSDLPKTSRPAERALATVDVFKLADLARFTEKEIADLHGMGPKALGILKVEMARHGLRFRDAAR